MQTKMVNNDKENISDTITLTKKKDRYNAVCLTSKSNFFSKEIIVKFKDNKLTFRRPSLENTSKTLKPNRMKDGRYQCVIHGKDLPVGKFSFDEDESNEDCIVVYFD